jgi:cell division septum initiation protein DivIVA
MVSLNSSLKFIDMSFYSKDDIISKLDALLVKREKQIHDMSLDTSALNERLNIVYKSNVILEMEKKELSEKVIKLQAQLRQELDTKEVLLTENSKMEDELNYLKKAGSFTSSGGSSYTYTANKSNNNSNIKNTAADYLQKMKNVFSGGNSSSASVNTNTGSYFGTNKKIPDNTVKCELTTYEDRNQSSNNSKFKQSDSNKIPSNIPEKKSSTSGVQLASDIEDYDFVF